MRVLGGEKSLQTQDDMTIDETTQKNALSTRVVRKVGRAVILHANEECAKSRRHHQLSDVASERSRKVGKSIPSHHPDRMYPEQQHCLNVARAWRALIALLNFGHSPLYHELFPPHHCEVITNDERELLILSSFKSIKRVAMATGANTSGQTSRIWPQRRRLSIDHLLKSASPLQENNDHLLPAQVIFSQFGHSGDVFPSITSSRVRLHYTRIMKISSRRKLYSHSLAIAVTSFHRSHPQECVSTTRE
ncbi:hypothetical protein J6590_090256 [Homalodisca vitripennis]|nr:hypothetical protein J6590_090256 [Homalodisca vitripennis]